MKRRQYLHTHHMGCLYRVIPRYTCSSILCDDYDGRFHRPPSRHLTSDVHGISTRVFSIGLLVHMYVDCGHFTYYIAVSIHPCRQKHQNGFAECKNKLTVADIYVSGFTNVHKN